LSRILGVDLGSRRIGLALSDPSGTLASPLEVITRSGDPARDRKAILAAADENEAEIIVVGLPKSLSGKKGPAERAALDEIDALRAAAPEHVAVDAYDERFTTVIAQRGLVESGMRRQDRKQVVDKVAAAVMLQSYLEARA
jgi:putative Holliday junction resolvase